jgi:hypothetical protein
MRNRNAALAFVNMRKFCDTPAVALDDDHRIGRKCLLRIDLHRNVCWRFWCRLHSWHRGCLHHRTRKGEKRATGSENLFDKNGEITMRRVTCFLAAACLSGLLGISTAEASEPAATAELPAAMNVLGVDQGEVVSQQEAEGLRGEGGSLYSVRGYVYVRNWVTNTVLDFQIAQPTVVSMVLTPWNFGISFWPTP